MAKDLDHQRIYDEERKRSDELIHQFVRSNIKLSNIHLPEQGLKWRWDLETKTGKPIRIELPRQGPEGPPLGLELLEKQRKFMKTQQDLMNKHLEFVKTSQEHHRKFMEQSRRAAEQARKRPFKPF